MGQANTRIRQLTTRIEQMEKRSKFNKHGSGDIITLIEENGSYCYGDTLKPIAKTEVEKLSKDNLVIMIRSYGGFDPIKIRPNDIGTPTP